ncbi:hypothetical protein CHINAEXTREME_20470 (plasmid) [Halobiforma lacisalsi AJ5]|uniref:Uncharacterized protein n=1 Tax=Natronobacterium lacisalsi AJ5 TaxID=358396 RepID=M0LYG6_NATLA|nr:hypothetical protein [Halobiforma lacisalsi]APX00190.1 hypothetical protein CHINAEXTREME_20470 [Halobiforma lacisalsi AJ5]EMA37394.1 hypothetical protein C445_00856 [Halobiforma lacisalsi AJ5]
MSQPHPPEPTDDDEKAVLETDDAVQYEAIQAKDETDVGTALENLQQQSAEQTEKQSRAEHEALVRKLIAETRWSLSGDGAYPADDLLRTLHWILKRDDDLESILQPAYDGEFVDSGTKARFRDHMAARANGYSPPSPERELETLTKIAKELNHLTSLTDPSQYAPVYLEKLDPEEVPHAPDIDEVTPIGRRRVSKDEAADLEDKEVAIPHDDCDHILAIAKPREGKDSTLTSIGMNLWREHGYKYISLHDDGRMETPMLAIPNDEEVIRNNLERFNQQPRAMDTTVYVPRMEGTPDVLPANFEPFTLGIDMLTPKDILRLAGVTDSDPSLELRIKEALEITLNRSKQVDQLINLLFDFAEGLEATIEWTEKQDRHKSDGSVETYEASFSLSAEQAVEKAAQRLARLAGEGFIASPDASTNLDFREMLSDNETAAVLCCNFIDASDGFKYTIMDLWLQKIMDARDEWPRLPRVCLEVRELKNVAPSQIQHARYKDQIRALQQTFRIIATQGGSRRVLLLGSTQKFNDVLRPVRNNMDTKILLRQGQEQVRELDKKFDFTPEQFTQLRTFETGTGMIYADGEPFWPIEWRGAPCGLGLGDKVWRDRYGKAWGARVRESPTPPWSEDTAPEWWVDVISGDVVSPDRYPAIGGWYLRDEDFPAELAVLEYDDAETAVTDRLTQWVLRNRRDYAVPSELVLEPVDGQDRQQDITLEQVGQETTYEDIATRYDVPRAISAWLRKDASLRQEFIQTCELVEANDYGSYGELYTALDPSFAEATLRDHASKDNGLGPCLEKDGRNDVWSLTPVGQQVLEVDWGAVETALEEVDR